MSEESTYEEQSQKDAVTKFQSPLPFILQLRDLIFGKRSPDTITKITFYLNLSIWFMFMLWTAVSSYAIGARDLIYRQKNVPIDYIIHKRGEELGYTGDDFVNRLSTYNLAGLILWALVFIGLVLLFRKMKVFIYFLLGSVVIYLLLTIFYLGWDYFMQDTTTFDKIALFTMIISVAVYYYLMKDKDYDEELNFFDLED